VAIFGAGPVGLMAAYSAKIKGAAEIYVVDQVPSRLELAEENCDATAIDFSEGDPVDQIIEEHGGMVDKGVDAVGYQATDPEDVDTESEGLLVRPSQGESGGRDQQPSFAWSVRPASSVSPACTCRRTRAHRTTWPRRGDSESTSGSSSREGTQVRYGPV